MRYIQLSSATLKVVLNPSTVEWRKRSIKKPHLDEARVMLFYVG
jgi:hypothetical protein